MNRGLVLGVLVAVGAASAGTAAYQAQQNAPKVLEAQKLKDNLYMLTGANSGGNTAVFIGTTGVVVVDTKNPGWGQPILDKIKELTPKPVTTIINTHTHGDHVSGNVEFPATVDIIVQENTKTNMEKMMSPPGMGNGATGPTIFQQNNGKGMPKHTFKDKMTIGKGADQIDLYYFGRGHTNGDAWIVWPALRFAHAGDIFSGKNLPLLDEQRRQRRGDRRLAREGARRDQERRSGDHRAQHRDDVGGSRRVRAVQQGLPGVRPGSGQGREERRRDRGVLEDRRCQVQGLQHPGCAIETERHGRRERTEEVTATTATIPYSIATNGAGTNQRWPCRARSHTA